jgi:hypothetical protein
MKNENKMRIGRKSALRQVYSVSKKKISTVGITFVLIILAIMIWKHFEIQSIKNSYINKEQHLMQETAARLEENQRQFLKLFARTYSWALGSAMMENDMHEIDFYGKEIARNKNIFSVIVVDEKGRVISSTDENHAGKYFVSFSSPYYLNVDTTILYKISEARLVLASPIIDKSIGKLGTLIIYTLIDNSEISDKQHYN